MPRKTLDIQFPTAGVIRRLGLRASSDGRGPYPAVWATNVRLEDSLNRLRGGSFTGIDAGTRYDPVYRDRAVQIDGNAIRFSRQGSHSSFDFSADISDTARATILQLAHADETGDTVVAVIPHKDRTFLCLTADSLWVLSGDPTTGALQEVSQEVGIIGADAWCKDHDTIYFLSSAGLYSVGADGSGLKAVSEDKIPEDLTGVEDDDCTLTYYHTDRGVYIHRSSGVSWFYDTERKGFWPFTTDTTDSHVLMGPFRLGNANSYGRVLNLHGIIAEGSDDVAWRLVTGDTAEEAAADAKTAVEAAVAGSSYSSYVKSEGTWSAGRAHMAYPRTRAVWCCLWLSSTGDWAYEGVVMGAVTSGRWK